MLRQLGELIFRRARLILVLTGILFLGAALLSGGAFGKLKPGGFAPPRSPSTQASNLLNTKFGGDPNLIILVHANSGTVDDPAVAGPATALASSLGSRSGVSTVTSYWTTHVPSLRSPKGADGLILMHVDGFDETADTVSKTIIDSLPKPDNDVTFLPAGQLGVGNDINDQVQQGMAIAEAIAIPITLVLLIFVFGALMAAVIPLIIGIVAIAGTFAELFLLGSVTDVSIYATNLTTALGLGLAIDYALLSVSRFREELAASGSTQDAVVRTVQTAGRTIAFSAGTVAVALASLLVFEPFFLRSFAYAGIGVVLISALCGVLVLPAFLAVLGPRINAGRLPWSKAVRGSRSRLWGRIAAAVIRQPILFALPIVALLVVGATPLRHVSFATPDDRVLPTSAASRQAGDILRAEFPGNRVATLDVVTTGAVPPAALASYAEQLSNLPHVRQVETSAGAYTGGSATAAGTPRPDLTRPDAEQILIAMDVDASSTQAQQLVKQARAVPAPAGVPAMVGGDSAVLVDTKNALASRLPLAAGLIVLTTFILLFLFTGSLVQPLRALLLNVLGLCATLGAMVFIFQDGHLSGPFGFTPLPLDTSMPVLLFCIAFGLSMDYEVFLISRIKELHDKGSTTRDAVVEGLARTGRIVSMAAALIAVSFFAFGTSTVSFGKFFGIGTGIAIIIDATLMRGVLVPASFRLLGRASWYLPRFLRPLQSRVRLVESESAPARREQEPSLTGRSG